MTLQPFQNRLTGPFQEGGDALSQPDTHAGNTKLPLLRLQLMTQCREESGAGTTERVPEGDGAGRMAHQVQLQRILPDHAQALDRKSVV